MAHPTKQYALAAALVLAAAASYAIRGVGQQSEPADDPVPAALSPDRDPHLLLGNPSRADGDPTNFLYAGRAFAVGYNADRAGPNWVSWRLRGSDFGPPRRSDFHPDPALPAGLRQVGPRDYMTSGFDRGQLCPWADRTATQEMTHAVFGMSNTVPVAPHLSRGAWRELEQYAGRIARRGAVVYSVAGAAGVGGEGLKGRADVVNGGATVPAKLWKVFVVVEGGTGEADDLALVTPATRVVAVVLPNDQTAGLDWGRYRVTVRELEQLTGYTFFDRLPPTVADALKSKRDTVPTRPTTD